MLQKRLYSQFQVKCTSKGHSELRCTKQNSSTTNVHIILVSRNLNLNTQQQGTQATNLLGQLEGPRSQLHKTMGSKHSCRSCWQANMKP